MRLRKIFVNGTFDVMHIGHIRLLEYAKSLGDYLVVALDSDRRVKELKGSARPINSLQDRIDFMTAISKVDEITSFDTDEELSWLVEVNQPDFMVVGEDYIGKRVIGSEFAGEVKYFSKVPDKSTTKILQSLL